MSLLYECVNTVIAGENHNYLVLKQMADVSGRPSPSPAPGGFRWEQEGTHPGGAACSRLVPNGCHQALPLWFKVT